MKRLVIVTMAAMLLIAACGEEQKKDMSRGEQVFRNSCMACHGLEQPRIGPALKGVLGRWNNDTTRIAAFIRNSSEMIKSGDPRAVQVAKEWNNTLMTPMPHLTDGDIKALLEYMAE